MEDYIHIFVKICFKEVRMRQFKKKENYIIIILIYVYDKIYMVHLNISLMSSNDQ